MEIRIKKKRGSAAKELFNNPTRLIVVSFAFLILLGTLLLMMPFSSAQGKFTSPVTALFTATSATCVTGLILADTGTYYSIFGQSVILFLIQVGGLGLVTFASLFNMLLGKRMRFRNLSLAKESISATSFSDIRHLITTIFTFSLLFELLGALILATVFVPQFGAKGVFISAFLSISAYCNGGFDILGFLEPYSSVCHYADNPVVLLTLAALIICGGLGFIVWQDLYRYRKNRRLSLHTRIVVFVTLALLAGGTFLIAAGEWNNPATIGNMPFWQKLLNSYFLSASTRTAGFNSFSINDMNEFTKVICIILMFIGAAPASTGGGIKVTTAVVLFMTVYCVLRDMPDTILRKHKIDKNTVYKSLTVTSIGMLAVAALVTLMIATPQKEHIPLVSALFESVSAFATVGIGVGVSAAANLPTKLAIILAMFLGRVGPISLFLSLTIRRERADENTARQELPEGNLLVG